MERAIGQRVCPAFLPHDRWENKICSTFLLPICNLFAAYQDDVSSRVHTVGLIVREVFDNINAMSAILDIKLSRRSGTRRTKVLKPLSAIWHETHHSNSQENGKSFNKDRSKRWHRRTMAVAFASPEVGWKRQVCSPLLHFSSHRLYAGLKRWKAILGRKFIGCVVFLQIHLGHICLRPAIEHWPKEEDACVGNLLGGALLSASSDWALTEEDACVRNLLAVVTSMLSVNSLTWLFAKSKSSGLNTCGICRALNSHGKACRRLIAPTVV